MEVEQLTVLALHLRLLLLWQHVGRGRGLHQFEWLSQQCQKHVSIGHPVLCGSVR